MRTTIQLAYFISYSTLQVAETSNNFSPSFSQTERELRSHKNRCDDVERFVELQRPLNIRIGRVRILLHEKLFVSTNLIRTSHDFHFLRTSTLRAGSSFPTRELIIARRIIPAVRSRRKTLPPFVIYHLARTQRQKYYTLTYARNKLNNSFVLQFPTYFSRLERARARARS